MLDTLDGDRLQALGDDPAAQYARSIIAQMQAYLKFQQTKIAALSFELARLSGCRVRSRTSIRCDRVPLSPGRCPPACAP